ncbi:MAG TPA: fatty acyl-AMP ligase [Amycolatopsis sp.]|uniref:fatty acyl-AMP ligase n=1 Tax=Amycolatopsis sp. TaxID=37632 RepID=UPI002B46A539|nr:fatty acyl-AMP ligase [Amycolatopsis sp.]HKS47386.1 fatty acyl-AMP ligase [Amycolatopsis sp.]
MLLADLRPLTSYLFARAESSEPAFTFLDYSADRDGVERTITWAELAERVRSVAAGLTRVTDRGERVAIMAPQDLTYVIGFLGALHAGTVAVPLFAPQVGQHGERLVNVLADCAPQVWLTSSGALGEVRALTEGHPVPMPKQIFAVDELTAPAGEATAPELDLDETAYLQYTSGSTGDPSGAMITHRAIAANAWQAASAFGTGPDWTCVGWIPFFHDMGLGHLIALPLMFGVRSVFMTPFDFIMRPARWLRQLANYPNTFSAAPNFAFEYAVRKTKDRSGLDLSGVRALLNGSEPVHPATISRFDEELGPYGLRPQAHRPCYGLAEATVMVTATRDEGPTVTSFDRAALAADRGVATEPGPDTVDLVAAGKPSAQQVRIVDPNTGVPRADDEVGEIWVRGPNVADGYWRRPERTEETFGGSIPGEPGRWLRTGDLGMFHDGLLYVTGRLKDLIIVDGRNHYPQDIEATVSGAHPAVRRHHVAAFSVRDADGVEGAAVVAELIQPDTDQTEVTRAIQRAVSAVHDVKLRGVKLVPSGSVLRTSSGKIARAATRSEHWDSNR